MDNLTKEQQETWLQTIQVRLEWNEKGGVSMFEDLAGPWKIVKNPPTSGMIRYFIPDYQEGFDEYGSTLNDKP